MKTVICILISCLLFNQNHGFKEKKIDNLSLLTGYWLRINPISKNDSDSLRIVFFPNKRVNIYRRGHNYMGTYELKTKSEYGVIRGTMFYNEKIAFSARIIDKGLLKLKLSDSPGNEMLFKKIKEIPDEISRYVN